ncbi:MAG: PIN domain nuclease, partial [Thermodesulfobacteriota bacterium]|nr:PIN domain nuclease [Thermodesulfobacteriota bacterium]
KEQFDLLKLHLEAFEDIELETKDYELASEYFNAARKKGIQGSNTDFLICAISSRREMPILTTDKDFTNFQAVFPVSLHVPRG